MSEHGTDDSATDSSPRASSRSPPPCPRCDRPVVRITSTGPDTHFASPCGCRIGRLEARKLR
ncbi:hypothetical protein [Halomontanus rarus]|uniref:hypothetical protein n=1 Tax=Halomontanus rarus TaxID=3034020 RepID=UPI001A99302B